MVQHTQFESQLEQEMVIEPKEYQSIKGPALNIPKTLFQLQWTQKHQEVQEWHQAKYGEPRVKENLESYEMPAIGVVDILVGMDYRALQPIGGNNRGNLRVVIPSWCKL